MYAPILLLRVLSESSEGEFLDRHIYDIVGQRILLEFFLHALRGEAAI